MPRTLPKVFRVTWTSNSHRLSGTGWFIRPNQVVTAFHVVSAGPGSREWAHVFEDAGKYEIHGLAGTPVRLTPLVRDADGDLAILESAVECPEEVIKLADAPADGVPSWQAVGFPRDEAGETILSGTDSQESPRNGVPSLQLASAQIVDEEHAWKGMSGGPVLDDHGRCIGVLREAKPSNIFWATSGVLVLNLLERAYRAKMSARQSNPTVALDEALGYSAQAIRAYLNANVVEGVELIYFLSYDPWDGCLVHGGLVQGSIEQTLLEFARATFLERDHPRSRYAEFREKPEYLGPAGRCFESAIKYALEESHDPFARLWYVGDLRAYHSEYEELDSLLGLKSCLYLPILLTHKANGSGPAPVDRQAPLGGVLVAGSRDRYGLKPLTNVAQNAWGHARGELPPLRSEGTLDEAKKSERQRNDRTIAGAIRAAFVDEKRPVFKQKDAGLTLMNLIGRICQERECHRASLRTVIHPAFVKSVALVTRGGALRRREWLRELAAELDQMRSRLGNVFALCRELRDSGCGRWGAREVLDSQEYFCAREYIAAYAWREILLALQSDSAPMEPNDQASLREKLKEPWTFGIGVPLDDFVRRPTELRRRSPEMPQTASLFADTVVDFLEELRDARFEPLTGLIRFLDELAPVSAHVRCGQAPATIVGDAERRQLVSDMAHTAHAFLLGLSVLRARSPDGVTLLSRTEDVFRRHLPEGIAPPVPFDQFLERCWGLTSAMHDIALPAQRFHNWCLRFLQGYFGDAVVFRNGGNQGAVVDIFRHPRFPLYKNALANLYRHRERDWLDTLICGQFSHWLEHSVAAALVFMSEIEPDHEYSSQDATWVNIPKALEIDEREPAPLEFCAFLAHAIALTHLPELRSEWLQKEQARPTQSKRSHLLGIARGFKVDLERFPFTYLLAFVDKLLAPMTYGEVPPGHELVRDYDQQAFPISPFYVGRVRVQNGDDGIPITELTVFWWASDGKDKAKLCDRQALANLEKQWMRAGRIRWILQHDEIARGRPYFENEQVYETLFEGDTYEVVKCRDCGGNAVQQIRVSLGAFECLRLVLGLKEFAKSFTCREWRFKIVLTNVLTDGVRQAITLSDTGEVKLVDHVSTSS